MKRAIRLCLAALCLLLLAVPALAGEVRLSVAASMKDVINELSAAYAKSNPAVKFLKNYGASGALAKQIENGAPADIFISANTEWMDYLQNRKLADTDSMSTFAYNTLVFAGTGSQVSSLQDLTSLNRIAIGSPRSVPAGEYATEALKKAHLDKQLEKKLVMAKDVRECLMYAERGEVDGAFVYRTDALQAKQARILFTVPQNLYPRVTYPMSLTLAGAKNRDAIGFIQFLRSRAAKPVLTKYGFDVR
jgi:molybdate transport system substrate-binding protein